LQGFPTIKFVYAEGDKLKSSDYNGNRSAKDMVLFAMEKAKNLALKRLGEKPSSGSGGEARDALYGCVPLIYRGSIDAACTKQSKLKCPVLLK
jgi:hypothetical protein